MKLKLILAALAIALSGCASLDTRERAINGQVADLGSTAIGLSIPGITEPKP